MNVFEKRQQKVLCHINHKIKDGLGWLECGSHQDNNQLFLVEVCNVFVELAGGRPRVDLSLPPLSLFLC